MISRLMPAAVAAIALLTAAGAAAQEVSVPNDTTSFHGVSAFQTSDLEDGPDVQILSGTAVAYQLDDGTYSILLFALDYYQSADGGERRVSATQSCIGEPDSGDLVITCEIVGASTDTYAPDNFRLTRVEDRHWSGVITSSGDKPVDFVDLD